MKPVYLLVAIACTSSIMLAGTARAQSVPDPVQQLVAAAKAEVRTVDMAEFHALYLKKSYDQLIDVREADEFAAGHIPGAINIPRGVIEFKIWGALGHPEKDVTGLRLYLYCKTGGRCALAAQSLKKLGFHNVTSVDMMLDDWKRAGYPLE